MVHICLAIKMCERINDDNKLYLYSTFQNNHYKVLHKQEQKKKSNHIQNHSQQMK